MRDRTRPLGLHRRVRIVPRRKRAANLARPVGLVPRGHEVGQGLLPEVVEAVAAVGRGAEAIETDLPGCEESVSIMV